MNRAYSDIAFTPSVRAMQTRTGSRSAYAPLDSATDKRDALTIDEVDFIRERDGFYRATVSESGWPYVQYRGGPWASSRCWTPRPSYTPISAVTCSTSAQATCSSMTGYRSS
jgi:hypothetical protein